MPGTKSRPGSFALDQCVAQHARSYGSVVPHTKSRGQALDFSVQPRRSPVAFLLLLAALAVPVWLVSPFLGVIGALKVPVSDLILGFTPMITAAILVG